MRLHLILLLYNFRIGMNHTIHKKLLDEYESSGPRPPVPGEESRLSKMTENYLMDCCSQSSTPSYLKWQHSLTNLLEDRDGVELFKRFVESEGGIHTNRLNFYFACEGLKQQNDPDKINQMVNAIYK